MVSRDICWGFTFLLPSCVKGQSLQMGLWDGWGSAQQLCWPTALPCCSTRRERWLALRWVLWGQVEKEPPQGSSAGRPHSCISVDGVDGAAVGQEWAALIAKAFPALLLTAYCAPF